MSAEGQCGSHFSYMEVQFICDTSVGGARVNTVKYEADECWWGVDISTIYACPGMVSSTSSPSTSTSSSTASVTSLPSTSSFSTAFPPSSTSAPSITSSYALSTSSPALHISCHTPGYNLTAISQSDLLYWDPVHDIQYWFHVCGAVQEPQCTGVSTAELCQRLSNGIYIQSFPHHNSTYYDLWNYPPLTYMLNGATDEGCGDHQSMEVQFYCDGQVAEVVSITSDDSQCQWIIQVYTMYACPNGPPSSSSAVVVPSSTSAPPTSPASPTSSSSCSSWPEDNNPCSSSSSSSRVEPALSSSSSPAYINCYTPGYDLTPIRQQDLTYFDSQLDTLYTMRVCGAVLSPNCQFDGLQTELCQQFSNGTIVSAVPHNESGFYHLFDSPLEYSVEAEAECGVQVFNVFLYCNQTVDGAVVQSIRAVDNGCSWTVTILTPYACAGRPSLSSSSSPLQPFFPLSSSSSSSPPSPRIICSTPGYDLSSIQQRDLVYFDTQSQVLYTIRPCGAVLSPNCQFSGNQTELCQQYSNGSITSAFPHNYSTPYPLQYISDQLLSYNLLTTTDSSVCHYEQFLNVEFECNMNVTGASILFVVRYPNECGYQVYIETQYACPGMVIPTSPSSTGVQVTPCANRYVDLSPLAYSNDLTYLADESMIFLLHPCSYVAFAGCYGASLCVVSGAGNVTPSGGL